MERPMEGALQQRYWMLQMESWMAHILGCQFWVLEPQWQDCQTHMQVAELRWMLLME
jgi:hypothetical protein